MKKGRIVLMIILILITLFCGIRFFGIKKDREENQEAFAHLSELIDSKSENPYAELAAKNSDFIGWISIDGTNVNYPVMQTRDNPDYYLKHNFEKEYSDFGVPYLDASCVVEQSNNLIIYGHHMNDGSMFADMEKYKDSSFWLEHQTIDFSTMESNGKYTVIAAFAFDTNNEEFNYTHYANMSESEFNEYLREISKRSIYKTSAKAEYGDELITLSTCEYTHSNGRFVVVAKKVA